MATRCAVEVVTHVLRLLGVGEVEEVDAVGGYFHFRAGNAVEGALPPVGERPGGVFNASHCETAACEVEN